MDISRLEIAVDSSDVKKATKQIERMADAVARLNAELEKLGDKDHGDASVEIVGCGRCMNVCNILKEWDIHGLPQTRG